MKVMDVGHVCLVRESGAREFSWIRAAGAGWYD